jgi:hypothetical protein
MMTVAGASTPKPRRPMGTRTSATDMVAAGPLTMAVGLLTTAASLVASTRKRK